MPKSPPPKKAAAKKVGPPQPLTARQEAARAAAAATKADAARVQRSAVRTATKKRRDWEASPKGVTRRQDIVDLYTAEYNKTATKHPDLFPHGPIERSKLTRGQIYNMLGVTNDGHGYGDVQLPGFENPHAVKPPPRWEELPKPVQKTTTAALRRQGTSLDQMKEDFGSQLDQSIWRAHMAGHHRESTGEPVPFTAHFYGEHPDDAPPPLDRPKEAMRESREYLAQKGIHIDPTVHQGVVGHTSPNVPFGVGERGNRTSPNLDAAELVIEDHARGVPVAQAGLGRTRRGIKSTARPANSRRAAVLLEHVAKGGTMGTSRNPPSKSEPKGTLQWGPKTGPFANSFDATTPDFLVSDVHTGGGAFFSHLSTEKPIKRHPVTGERYRTKEYKGDPRSDDELAKQLGEGRVFARDKSAREKAIETSGSAIPGSEGKKVTFHSAADFAARQAIAERGLGSSVRRPQASQWGEEQVQRKENDPTLHGAPTHEMAYPPPPHPLLNPHQLKLF